MVPDMFAALRGWKAIGVKNFGVYEYLYAYNGSRIAPGYYPHDIADYFRRFRSLYGPAEKPVRRFHEIAEAAYARRKAKPDWCK